MMAQRLLRKFDFLKAIILVFFALPAFAQTRLIDQGNTKLDTATGLEWLDLTETVGMSFIDVSDQLGEGGAFEGYRHATSNEILDIFFALNLTQTFRDLDDNVELFIALFGVTDRFEYPNGSGYSESSIGFVGPAYSNPESPELNVLAYAVHASYSEFPSATVQQGNIQYNAEISFPGFATYLVRSPHNPQEIPELNAASTPLSIGLLSLICMILRERRKKYDSEGHQRL